MGFTTQVFLFLFFPISLLGFTLINRLATCKNVLGRFLLKIRAREIVVIFVSLAFYAWAGIGEMHKLLIYIFLVYLLGKWIEGSVAKQRYVEIRQGAPTEEGVMCKKFYLSQIVCTVAVALLLCYLLFYKYLGLFLSVFNRVFASELSASSIIAPVGLSFITFSAISYLVDVYRKKATAGSLIDCALYLSFFPKIISGPIVLWQDFQPQIGRFRCGLEQSVDGLVRIIVGFAKKVILADTFGACVAHIGLTGIDQITACGVLVLYMLQIYYDFAGYSDIAIGLAKLFGLQFKENFNFPYRSKSITEFWRRWHISLGTWFREYVYFPLGGSRAGMKRTLLNLGVVFLLTGIWHGSTMNYILWGVLNGVIMIIERLLKDTKFYKKTPSFIKYGVTMFAVLLLWQLFRFQDTSQLKDFFNIILGRTQFDRIPYTWRYYFDAQIIVLAIIGILGSTVLGGEKVKQLYAKAVATKVGFAVQGVVLIVLFVLAIIFMVNSTYSPFIYFQY